MLTSSRTVRYDHERTHCLRPISWNNGPDLNGSISSHTFSLVFVFKTHSGWLRLISGSSQYAVMSTRNKCCAIDIFFAFDMMSLRVASGVPRLISCRRPPPPSVLDSCSPPTDASTHSSNKRKRDRREKRGCYYERWRNTFLCV